MENDTMQKGSGGSVGWAALVGARRLLNVQQGVIARRMGLSASAICLRERGTKAASDEFVRRYRSALAAAVAGELETEGEA